MADINHYTQQNQRAWNEIALVRAQRAQPAAFFAGGRITLSERDLEAAGDVHGRSLLHLQCATGEDTLSWAVLGAQAVGTDISDEQIAIAAAKASAANLAVRFVAADLYDLPPDLQAETFDLVYTGGGALVWLPDLVAWARIVAQALKPGGRLILYEEHPIAWCLESEEGRLILSDDYFRRERAYEDRGWAHFKGGEGARELKYEFLFPLGDVVTAVAEAGLRIMALREFPATANYRFEAGITDLASLPGSYLLLARKEL